MKFLMVLFSLMAVVVGPARAVDRPTDGPLGALQVQMTIINNMGGSKSITLLGNGNGAYRVKPMAHESSAQDKTFAFTFRPQELLDLINRAVADRFLDLPSPIMARTTFKTQGDSNYVVGHQSVIDAGSTIITIAMGEYRKTVEYSNGVGIPPLWLVDLGNRIRLFAEYRTTLGGKKPGEEADNGGQPN